MRPLRLVVGLAAIALAGCAAEQQPRPPPPGAFYFPTGIVHVPNAGSGFLYVASSNVDKRYDHGLVTPVDLDALPTPLPPVGSAVDASGPKQLVELGINPENLVAVQSFTGE